MSTTPSIDADCRSLVALGVWQKASSYNWALMPQTSEVPVIAAVDAKSEGPVVGRLLLFPGFDCYRDFAILKQAPDMGFALTALDVRHWELIGLKDGGFELHSFRPGYLPQPVSAEGRAFLAPLLHECLGLLMRIEEEPELPTRYVAEGALFARTEGLDGKWHDGPLAPPKEPPRVRPDKIALDRPSCVAAARLPFVNAVAWEVDLFAVPACHTDEPHPRILYLLAAVDARSGQRMLWDRISVSGRSEEGLQPIWESLAQRLLAAMLKRGCIPGSVNIRSARMARFLRPLGLQIPFRLVQHSKLPALDRALQQALQTKTF